MDGVGLGNSVLAGQAAFSYSLMRPSHRVVLITATLAGIDGGWSSAASGGRCSRDGDGGPRFENPLWVQPLDHDPVAEVVGLLIGPVADECERPEIQIEVILLDGESATLPAP